MSDILISRPPYSPKTIIRYDDYDNHNIKIYISNLYIYGLYFVIINSIVLTTGLAYLIRDFYFY